MARRAGGHGRREVVPGVRAALLDRLRMMDSAFCLRPFGDACSWCGLAAELKAGGGVVSGDRIWSSMHALPLTPPNAYAHLLRDETSYAVVGPGSIEAVS